MTCPARLHTGAAGLGDISCRLDEGHGGRQHDATGLFAHQTISWFEGDRRQFTGEFHPCDQSTCLLPAGHHGRHAA